MRNDLDAAATQISVDRGSQHAWYFGYSDECLANEIARMHGFLRSKRVVTRQDGDKRLRLYQPECQVGIRLVPQERDIQRPVLKIIRQRRREAARTYRAINSRVVVPTLALDDGTVIGEVPAIIRYLDEAYPAVPLLGRTPKEQAVVAMWERRTEPEGFAPVMEGVRNAVERLKGRAIAGPHDYEQIPAIVERSRQRVANFYGDFEARQG